VALVRDGRQRDCPLHTHEFSEIVIVLAGDGFHVTDRNEYPIARGDAFLIQAGRAHGYRVPRRLSVANILFDRAALGIPLNDLTAMPGYHALFTLEPLHRKARNFADRLRLGAAQLARASALVDEFEREAAARAPGYVLVTASLFLQIVVHLSRCYAEADAPAVRPSAGVSRALGFLEGQAEKPVTLAQVARVARMSESSLLREFKRATGRSPIDYHLRLRIGRACELLRSSDRAVAEIASDVGFADPGYFARRFRAAMGVSPREYRRREASLRYARTD
jgi:AraC-like DNA-binding protein